MIDREEEHDPREPYWLMAERYPELVKQAIEVLGYPQVRQLLSGTPEIDWSRIEP